MSDAREQPIHATLIAVHLGAVGRRGVLLKGASGSGKSDFALRALGEGWRLVADDRVAAWACEGRVFGRAPPTLVGLLEVRGQTVLPVPTLLYCEIVLTARLRPPPERQPKPDVETVAGLPLPAVDIAPFEASGPQRLRRIVEQITARL